MPVPDIAQTALDIGPAPPQQVVRVRRAYNRWVASETMEDYALRFTPRSFRRLGAWRVANTAFGASSFLILEAVGATLLLQHGFVNAVAAILTTGLIIALAGWPISLVAARHGLDMDLLTRGAGFGYLGSTITSLVYASFTFIFFALEAAVMAYALELAFDIPPAWGYGICALVVLPLVSHGVTAISRLQVWTQALWLVLLVAPWWPVLSQAGTELEGLSQFGGLGGQPPGFRWVDFGAALTVGIALVMQMGEQVDYLRFMPEAPGPQASRRQRWAWWGAVALGGPGWVVPGVLKMLAGVVLAWLALAHAVPPDRAVDPTQMYLVAWEYVFPQYGWAVAATALFVVVSQLKINVTNAYAGSLAWSNFFSRLTHSHPGRVVWVVFNLAVALVLMEMNVFQALGHVLGLFSNIAIAWIMAVVADLVISKPMGWSPPGVEFRRAYLVDINPVGVGAMGLASVLSIVAHLGAFGPMAQAFSAMIALSTAMISAPLIAWATKGRHALARRTRAGRAADMALDTAGAETTVGAASAEAPYKSLRCVVCEGRYEPEDMAGCPAYGGPICSLCCTLEARCDDQCKPHGRWHAQWLALLRRLWPRRWAPWLERGLAEYLLWMLLVLPALAALIWGLQALALRPLSAADQVTEATLAPLVRSGFAQAYAALALVAAMVAWWLVLAQRGRRLAQAESRRQTQTLHRQAQTLTREIASRQRADARLQQAMDQADAANQAKSRYITTISHELRTPLNGILGYAQLLEDDPAIPEHRREAVQVIRRAGDHLLGLIEGTLDIARIESGRLTLDTRPMRLDRMLDDLVQLIEPQATARGLGFVQQRDRDLPLMVRADERRLRQILINLLGNAVKFTRQGQVRLSVSHVREMARFEIEDTGPGMTAQELQRVFEPFERGSAAGDQTSGGTGLGLTIARMLTALMGGELAVRSEPGQGTCFTVRLYLPVLHALAEPGPEGVTDARRVLGYEGDRRRLLVVDNEGADRRLLVQRLAPLGFEVLEAASGEAALALLARTPVDAVFMDLAMPGIDGWTTLQRWHVQAGAGVPAAIVSANAYDKGLPNSVGIAAQDFLVKPVRLSELLDWLGRRLKLTWQHAPAAQAAQGHHMPLAMEGDGAWPPVSPDGLRRLRERLQLGHLRGVLQALDQLEADTPQAGALLARWRELARGFQFDALTQAADLALASGAKALPDLPPRHDPLVG